MNKKQMQFLIKEFKVCEKNPYTTHKEWGCNTMTILQQNN